MITVTYKDDSFKTYKTFNDIINNELVIKIDCSRNNLTQLPEHINFPNLQTLNCHSNKLTYLPEHMDLPNLQKLIFFTL
jgi:Leucine-rich repeat (LRR) protein